MAGLDGMPHPSSALGISIGTRGLLASGVEIPGAVPPDRYDRHAGSSYAASFVTGTYSLLRSCNRNKDSNEIWEALLRPNGGLTRHNSVVPPLLNGDRALDRIRRPLFDVQSKWVLKL
jgi:subtilisin family serine protease